MKIIYLCKLLSILQIYISAISNIRYPLFLVCTYEHKDDYECYINHIFICAEQRDNARGILVLFKKEKHVMSTCFFECVISTKMLICTIWRKAPNKQKISRNDI